MYIFTVETWKYHDKSIRCPACGVKEAPIILKQQKFTSSRLAAFCLMGLVIKKIVIVNYLTKAAKKYAATARC